MATPWRAGVAAMLATWGGHAAVAGLDAEVPGADRVPPPPDHPALRERFHFPGPVLRVHRRGQRRRALAGAPQRRLLSNRWAADLLAVAEGFVGKSSEKSSSETENLLSEPRFPESLKDDFDPMRALGSGSFGVTYLAQEKKTGKEVAVKVLMNGFSWLRPSEASNPEFQELIEESKDECIKARRIHDNDRVDAEGGRHVVRCLEDGITETLDDPKLKDHPLFIVMNFVGKNAMDWWTGVMSKEMNLEPTRISKLLQTASRQMMLGLRLLTHGGAPLRWVHHDLKPENMAVIQDGTTDDEPVLSIIDLGTATSNATPPERKTVCTPMYQPPELAGPANYVGYSLPMHSFDASSAALALLGMAGSPTRRLMGIQVPSPYPMFYSEAVDVGLTRSTKLSMLSEMASCIAARSGHRRDDFDKWMQAYEDCLHIEGHFKYVGAEIESVLDEVREKTSEADRITALIHLISCNGLWASSAQANPAGTFQIVSEWVATGFDKVLLAMLELDPAKRPTPEEVLRAEWLQESYEPRRAIGSPPPLLCPTTAEKCEPIMFWNMALPFGLILAASILSFVLCCLGACCHCVGNVPSSAFTGLVAALFAVSTAAATTLWMSSIWHVLFLCASFVLGPGICLAGCRAAWAPAEPSARKAWSSALSAALAFNVLVYCAMQWAAGPTVELLSFIRQHHTAFSNAQETKNVGFKPDLVAVNRALGSAWFTFFPPWGGLITSIFGIWRDHVSARRAAAVGNVHPDVSGTEMSTAAGQADPEDEPKNP